jgi:hypothetical protein
MKKLYKALHYYSLAKYFILAYYYYIFCPILQIKRNPLLSEVYICVVQKLSKDTNSDGGTDDDSAASTPPNISQNINELNKTVNKSL